MSKVQQQYLVKTVTKKELPAPPSDDSWHNPEGIPVERIPDGMRLLSSKEIKFNMSKKFVGDFYRIYDGETSHIGGWDGDCDEYTYFTDKQYPIWERPQFLGYALDGSKFYGGLNQEGEKAIILAESFSSRKCQIVLLKGFSMHNAYGNDFLNGIRKFMKVYEFDSILDLAKWAEQKD